MEPLFGPGCDCLALRYLMSIDPQKSSSRWTVRCELPFAVDKQVRLDVRAEQSIAVLLQRLGFFLYPYYPDLVSLGDLGKGYDNRMQIYPQSLHLA